MGGTSSSSSGVPLLLPGGLLKGEILSLLNRLFNSKVWLASAMYDEREGITGFSALLIGGGIGLVSLTSRSRLNSVDRRGGGGDGGWDGPKRGDLRGSRIGVCGRLGIRKFLGPAAGDDGLTRESVLRKPARSPTPGVSGPLFGGECGGSTRSDGGCVGRGLAAGGPGRVGELGPLVLEPWGCNVEMFSLSLGLTLGTAGGSRTRGELAASRKRSGLGAGDTALGGGGPVWVCVGVERSDLFRFSNLARSDDTGLMDEPSSPSLAGEFMAG